MKTNSNKILQVVAGVSKKHSLSKSARRPLDESLGCRFLQWRPSPAKARLAPYKTNLKKAIQKC